MSAMATILAWLGGEVVFLEDELEKLGWRGSLGMNGFVKLTVVGIIDEVVLNKVVFTVSEGMVEHLGVATVREANSTYCWK